jgi:CBS domain-containing protein
VPIVEEDMTLVGLISEFDLLKAMTNGKDLRKIAAAEIMTPEEDLVTVTEDMPIMDLAKILEESHLVRVPVVKGKTLVGIVARQDIVFGYVKAVSSYWP